MSSYTIDLTPYDFIDKILLIADIGGTRYPEDSQMIEQETDAYIQAHPDFVKYVLPDGDTAALHIVRIYKYYGTAKYLLERGADVNYVNPRTKKSILDYALEDEYSPPPEFIEYIRNHPAFLAMERARSAKGFLQLGPKGLGPKSTSDTESKVSSFLTGEEGSVEQQAATLKKKATGARRKTKKNKKNKKRRKTRK
jgi:hypothetical protein